MMQIATPVAIAILGIQAMLENSRDHFTSAATTAQDPAVKEMLRTYGRLREGLMQELANDLRQHVEGALQPRKRSGRKGRSVPPDATAPVSDSELLTACERQETYLLGLYDDLLGHAELNDMTRASLVCQQAQVLANVDRVKRFRQLWSVKRADLVRLP